MSTSASVFRRIGGAFAGCIFGPPKHDKETERERWDSRAAFILAASGSAIGLGNLWRFPALAFQYGGGAFFLPYLLALFLIGIPIAILEFALGQVVQSGDIACFGSMHRRLRGVGLGSVFGAYMVVIYYNVIVAWACIYIVNSFKSTLPWDVDDSVTGEDVFKPAEDFFDSVLRVTAEGSAAQSVGGDQLGAMLFVWIAIAAIVWKGVSRTSKVVYVTMLVPLCTLLVLLIRGATLEGAGEGIRQYIGQWDVSVLSQGSVWSDAVAQIFFSIGVTFGVMTAYSSYNSRYQNTVSDALIISLVNSGVSIVAGFAVFSVLGWLSLRSGIPIADLDVGGFSLAFLTYPLALAELPASNFFNFLFFLTLFLLGIDSAFALVEAVCTAIKDSSKYSHVSRGTITAIVCVLGFFVGLLYITNIGLYFLDVVDTYVSGIGMLFIGFMETFSSGWIYRIEEHEQLVGHRAVYALIFGWIGSTLLGSIIGALSQAWIGAVIALVILVLATGYAWIVAEDNDFALGDDDDEPTPLPRPSWVAEPTKFWKLFFFPVEALRGDLNAVIKAEGDGLEPETKWAIPFVWSVFIRYFIPPILVILFVVGIDGYIADGGYGGYPAEYQVAGLGAAIAVVLLVVVPMFKPELLDGLMPNKLSGAQKLGALVPIGETDDDELDKNIVSVKAAGSGLSSDESLEEGNGSGSSSEEEESEGEEESGEEESEEEEASKSSTKAADVEVELTDAKKKKRKSLSAASDSE